MRCEPANSLIIRLGGLTKVSRMVDTSPHTVMKWRMPREKGGTGGVIPHWHHANLRAAALELGFDLTASDFLPETFPQLFRSEDAA